jgi:hypothetical protein
MRAKLLATITTPNPKQHIAQETEAIRVSGIFAIFINGTVITKRKFAILDTESEMQGLTSK